MEVGQVSGLTAQHSYDAAGREIQLLEYFAPETIRRMVLGVGEEATEDDPKPPLFTYVDVGGWLSRRTVTATTPTAGPRWWRCPPNFE